MGLAAAFRAAKARWRAARAIAEIETRRLSPLPHGLDTPLAVSLTSYTARYPTLAPTLRSLLRQTVKPDRLVLWLTPADAAVLPAEVRRLEGEGLEIATAAELRSFKKIIPALTAMPGHCLVTADDDVYYWPDWLEGLVAARRATGQSVLCHRAHRIRLGGDGLPLPYGNWDRRLDGPAPSGLIFPTGVHGVLYAPDAFHADVLREDLFLSLCPSADDVWLYWMHRLRGHRAMQVGRLHRVLEWPQSQQSNLRSANTAEGGNDRAIAAMIRHYGFPAP
ncbi:glycosyltransferase family 2 protein [Cereibacter sphaeroides]|uniref:glycosyltransferase family 2 protein n=1 Tax=Cereibacter sphaeroides TaxID=1063 RepID=UPI001F468932|nr:glycosyltransferase family 2 protein [Cereibacter sphaeroides]MCE6952502.1 glycosyltransferase family 2 protein [Cereibacter sphaeroides]